MVERSTDGGHAGEGNPEPATLYCARAKEQRGRRHTLHLTALQALRSGAAISGPGAGKRAGRAIGVTSWVTRLVSLVRQEQLLERASLEAFHIVILVHHGRLPAMNRRDG